MRSLAAVLFILVLLATPVGANTDSGSTSGITPDADTTSSGAYGGITFSGLVNQPGGAVGHDPCSYFIADLDTVYFWLLGWTFAADVGSADPPVPTGPDDPDFARPWAVVMCPNTEVGMTLIDRIFQLGDQPEVNTLLEAARRSLEVPLPDPEVNPDESVFQVVGVETWLWVDPDDLVDQVAQACIGPYACITVRAVFAGADFLIETGERPGSTTRVPCADGGRAYDTGRTEASQRNLSHCGYVFIYDGMLDIVPTTDWTVSWACTYDADLDLVQESSCGAGALAPIDQTSPATTVEVREYQAQVTG